jgi:hypothetical protein
VGCSADGVSIDVDEGVAVDVPLAGAVLSVVGVGPSSDGVPGCSDSFAGVSAALSAG